MLRPGAFRRVPCVPRRVALPSSGSDWCLASSRSDAASSGSSSRSFRGLGQGVAQSSRSFATASFTVPARGKTPEQSLFVVGLNKGKFFGQDSSEEGLKLLERVAEHHPEYELLVGLPDKDLEEIEKEQKVQKNRLTPSRDLEKVRNGHMVPMIQAGMVDKRPRLSVERPLRSSQSRVAWILWRNPVEAVKLYWAYWQRKKYVDAAQRRFWTTHFPISSFAWFGERSELIAIRAVEQLAVLRGQDKLGAVVLLVGNDVFDVVIERVGRFLDEQAADRLCTPEFSQELRDGATTLCIEVPDLTVLLVFIYIGMPMLLAQFIGLGMQRFFENNPDAVLHVEKRD